MCEHEYVYGGVRYEDGEYHLPGTSAHPREYFNWFYCKKCLRNEYQRLATSGDTYGILFDAKPKPQERSR
jgi:hypothetical protein